MITPKYCLNCDRHDRPIDYDDLRSDNLSLSINPINHSSDGTFFVGNHLKPDI